MPLHIVIDARRIRDFGIGTYIRSLAHALGEIDTVTRYTLVVGPSDANLLADLPENFQSAIYSRIDSAPFDNLAFPAFVHSLAPDVVHITMSRIPLFMVRPYVVTIHDMAYLLFQDEVSGLRLQLRRYRFRRGLARASRVIAVSESTKRDVEAATGLPPERIRRVYNAPDPVFFAGGTEAAAEARQRIMERYQINYPYLLYAGNIRRHKNVPRLVEAFAVARDQLASHPDYKDLRLVIIGDTISQYPAVRQAVMKSRVEHLVRFLGFVEFETLLYRAHAPKASPFCKSRRPARPPAASFSPRRPALLSSASGRRLFETIDRDRHRAVRHGTGTERATVVSPPTLHFSTGH